MKRKIVQLTDKKNETKPLPITVSDAVYITGTNPLSYDLGLLRAGDNINGMTLSQFINRAYCKKGNYTFLHMSDPHRYAYGLRKCKELMDSDESMEMTLVTGDLQITNEMKQVLLSDERFYLMLGNHDVADDFSNNQLAAKTNYITPYMDGKVSFGDNGPGSYWYKDIQARNAIIRLISFDEYEYTAVGLPAAGKYSVVYSEAQIRWFIDLLRKTPNNYYLILAHHQPVSSLRDQLYKDLFISENAPGFYEHEGIRSNNIADNVCLPWFIPKILDAYLNKGQITGEFYLGSTNGAKITLNENFTGIPCKFLFHIGGHTHWDVCEYLPLYPNQLQLIIDQDRSQKYTYSDLSRNTEDESAYCINKITLDFDNRKTIIERLGAHITDSGADRNYIEYVFDKI